MRCPSCDRAQEALLLCECGTPLAAELDYFAVFDLPRKLVIDNSQLAERYHNLGRRIHPDRFASASAQVRVASLTATALLTRAYRALSDPVARGRYWLELHDHKLTNQTAPPELAEMVFEVEEAIADFRAAQPDGADSKRAALDEPRREVSEQLAAAGARLETIFAAFDQSGDGATGLFEELKAALARIAYLQTLERDLAKALDIRAAA